MLHLLEWKLEDLELLLYLPLSLPLLMVYLDMDMGNRSTAGYAAASSTTDALLMHLDH